MASFKEFFQIESAGGIVLMIAAALALVLANSPVQDIYVGAQNSPLLFWVNDGLMAVFFFMVGAEIRREMSEDGALATRAKAILPFLAAAGGMIAPALIFYSVNHAHPENLMGWAIPAATDIAFAMCVIALAGSRVPMALKVLLLAIAVIDDLGAIVIIAVFYGHGFHATAFAAAIAIMGVMAFMNYKKVSTVWPYILFSVLLWVAVWQSGIHATLAGVAAAMMVPLRFELDHKIHPAVTFGILPLFGLLNAGVSFAGMGWGSFAHPLSAGIILGLLLGKPLGIFGTLYIAVKTGISPMPEGVRWGHIFGMSLLCGIGFTMSLFIGGLAFSGVDQQAAIRLGVLAGSVMAALGGYIILRRAR